MSELAGGGWSCQSASSFLSRHPLPLQPLRQIHLAVGINGVKLEHRLYRIETKRTSQTSHILREAGGLPIHHVALLVL
jgi:hypothetical protein